MRRTCVTRVAQKNFAPVRARLAQDIGLLDQRDDFFRREQRRFGLLKNCGHVQGVGTASSSVAMTVFMLIFSTRALTLGISRWRRQSGAMSRMSSGVTKSRPRK